MALIIKGNSVVFVMKDGQRLRCPPSYGIIHDPDGEHFSRCEVFIGPIKKTQRRPTKSTNKANRYFGTRYVQKVALVDVPKGPWNPVGECVEILYKRPGQYANKYFHIFKKRSPMVSKCKRYYRLNLKDGCIIDDRGFVFP